VDTFTTESAPATQLLLRGETRPTMSQFLQPQIILLRDGTDQSQGKGQPVNLRFVLFLQRRAQRRSHAPHATG